MVSIQPEDAAEDTEAAPKGLSDTALAILKSTEAIIAGIISILALLGIGLKLRIRLIQAKEALHTVAHTIEKHAGGSHKTSTKTLKGNIKDAAAEGSPAVANLIHDSAKIAEKLVNGKK